MNTNEFIKRNKNIALIIILGFLLIGVGSFLSQKQNNSKNTNNDFTGQAFFFQINDHGEKKALFDVNGNMIYDFIFDYASDFYDGLATVEVDKKYGIINEKGEYVVPLGKYNIIFQNENFIVVKDENNELFILKPDLKTKISIGNYKKCYVSFVVNPYLIVIGENDIKIINKLGTVIKELEREDKGEDFNYNDLEDSRSNSIFATIIYNDKMVVIDNKTYEILYDGLSEGLKEGSILNDNGIIFTSDLKKHIVLYNKQLIPVECDYYDNPFQTNIKTCEKGEEKYIINNDGTLTQKYYNADSEYIDKDNYALGDYKEKKLEIYSNGKLVKTIDDAWVAFKSDQSYTIQYYNIRTKNNELGMSLIDKEGNIITKKIYEDVTPLDKNAHYIVKDDDGLEYLMNLEGEKISKGYFKINLDELAIYNHYKVYDKDYNAGFLDSTGKEVIPIMFKSEDGRIAYGDENEIIVGGHTKDNKNIIYSSKYKELLNIKEPITYMYLFNSFVSFDEDYENIEDMEVTFYTIRGKQFYQRKGLK